MKHKNKKFFIIFFYLGPYKTISLRPEILFDSSESYIIVYSLRISVCAYIYCLEFLFTVVFGDLDNLSTDIDKLLNLLRCCFYF